MPFFVVLKIEDGDQVAIAGGEYFWDADPGVGNGVSIDAQELIDGVTMLNTEGLDLGMHYLGMRLQHAGGQWGVAAWDSLTVCTNYNTLPEFAIELLGHTLLVSDNSTHADAVAWSLAGDTLIQDSLWNPVYELNSGNYSIEQTVWNECDTSSVTQEFVVLGATSITPDVGALGESQLYDVFGSFEGIASITLSNGVESFEPEYELLDSNSIQFVWDLPGDESTWIGSYDLCTTFEDGQVTCLSEAVAVDTLIFSVQSTIQGPGFVRENVPTPFQITAVNNGNATIYGVPVSINVMGPCEVYYHLEADSPDYDSWPTDPFYSQVPEALQILEHHAMKILSDVEGDSIWTNTAMIPSLVPGVPVTIDIEITGLPNGGGVPVIIESQMSKPWFTAEDMAPYLSDTASVSGVPPTSAMLSECDMLPPCLDLGLTYVSYFPGFGCGVSAFNLGCALGECINTAAGLPGGSGTVADQCMKDGGLAVLGALSCVTPARLGKTGAKFLDYWGKGNNVTGGIDILTGGNCECFSGATCGGDQGSSNIVGSLDPNEKVGPLGWSDTRWLAVADDVFNYRISCENVDSATAPAAMVRMVDTLDVDLFDLDQIMFDEFSFADTTIELNQWGPTFIRQVDLRPAKNALLRVQGSLDVESGILEVVWTSLNPETANLTYEIDAGFLNPNVTPPEGEAHVDFTLPLQAGVAAHELMVNNVADIYFDGNESVRTDPWTNRMEGELPVSVVVGAEPILGDTNLLVVLNNVDEHSGVRYVRLFRGVSDESGIIPEFVGKFSALDSILVPLSPQDTTSLFAVAEDGVGNMEAIDASMTFDMLSEFTFFPITCNADFTGDNVIDSLDLLAILDGYGAAGEDSALDLSGNGWVGSGDLVLFLTLVNTACF